MINKILRVGDSAAVTLSKSTLKELGVAIGDKVLVSFLPELNEIVIKPLTKKRRKSAIAQRIAKLTADFIDRYRPALEDLAKR
ncbi:MAG: hypothetical protein AABZ44_04140 [Elusimicrobiota bacterium]